MHRKFVMLKSNDYVLLIATVGTTVTAWAVHEAVINIFINIQDCITEFDTLFDRERARH